MRPLRLTMQAFGPYAGCEHVDFEGALEFGLFGIYGPTGSGKSSIFNGMAFALFGETAQGGRDTGSLRSDHSSPDQETKVELVFDVGPNRYLVRRRPEQERQSKRGDKLVRDQHAAWLFDVTGISVSEISDENTGKPIAEKKVRDVDAAIREVLGYGAAQFRQIVLLPQGRFETFLTAKTEERLAILRELFDVSLYRRLTDKLKEEAGDALANFQVDRKVVASQLEAAGFSDLETLESNIIEVQEQVETLKEKRDAARAAAKAASDAVTAGNALMDKFKALDAAVARLAELNEKEPMIEGVREQVRQLSLASKAIDLEGAVDREVDRAREAEEALQEAVQTQATAEKRTKEAEQAWELAVAKEPEKGRAREFLARLDGYRKLVVEAGSVRTRVGKAQEVLKKATSEHEGQVNQISKAKKTRADLQTQLSISVKAEAESARISREIAAVTDRLREARDYQGAIRRRDQSQEALGLLNNDWAEKKRALEKADQVYRQAEAALAAAQAYHLAQDLVPGEPCPVCGALDHPTPAHQTVEGEARDSAFREARNALKAAKDAEGKAQGKVIAEEAILNDRNRALAELTQPSDSAEPLEARLSELQGRATELADVEPSSDVQERIDQVGAALESLEGREPELQRKLTQAEVELGTANEALRRALGDLPEEYRDPGKIESEFEKSNATLNEIEESQTKAGEERQNARETLAGANAKFKAAEKAVAETKEAIQSAREGFEGRLKELGLDIETYQYVKDDIPELEALQEEVNEHRDALTVAKENLKTTRAAVEGQDPPDLEALENQRDIAEEASEQASKSVTEIESDLGGKTSLKGRVIERLKEIDAAEEEFKILGRLAADFRGDNPARMTLEAYAIAAMFDHVLAAANLRLGPMTGGRYSLDRAVDQGDRRGRRGLGIAVFDLHTGKQRPTDTLSGGESFMAALSLALGLSDVVQTSRGSVRLDTIFIDEGFGSLDRDTLDQALQTLQDLTSGSRSVGLISHVDLVQQEIPFGFLIEKGVKGSRIITSGR